MLSGRFCQSGGHCESIYYEDTDYGNLQNMMSSAFRGYAGWIVDVYPTITEKEVVTIPETPPETFEVGSVNNPYVFVISGDATFMQQIKNYGGSILSRVEPLLNRLGYSVQYIGWDASGSEYHIGFVKRGTEPISLTLLLLIGIIAVALIFVVYSVRFSIRAFMDGKVLIEREDTIQAWIDGNTAVLESPYTSDEDKQNAADNLTNPSLPETPSERDIPESPSGAGGFLGGIGTGTLLALAIVYLLSRKK